MHDSRRMGARGTRGRPSWRDRVWVSLVPAARHDGTPPRALLHRLVVEPRGTNSRRPRAEHAARARVETRPSAVDAEQAVPAPGEAPDVLKDGVPWHFDRAAAASRDHRRQTVLTRQRERGPSVRRFQIPAVRQSHGCPCGNGRRTTTSARRGGTPAWGHEMRLPRRRLQAIRGTAGPGARARRVSRLVRHGTATVDCGLAPSRAARGHPPRSAPPAGIRPCRGRPHARAPSVVA
jgi:hypothetical protein